MENHKIHGTYDAQKLHAGLYGPSASRPQEQSHHLAAEHKIQQEERDRGIKGQPDAGLKAQGDPLSLSRSQVLGRIAGQTAPSDMNALMAKVLSLTAPE